jgi:hypothetical protein
MSKPIVATYGNCGHCESVHVKNLAGEDEVRYICEFSNKPDATNKRTYSKSCSMYDWTKCNYNEDK